MQLHPPEIYSNTKYDKDAFIFDSPYDYTRYFYWRGIFPSEIVARIPGSNSYVFRDTEFQKRYFEYTKRSEKFFKEKRVNCTLANVKNNAYPPQNNGIYLYDRFYYIAHVDNLASIIRHGFLSRNQLIKKGLTFQDISMNEVQDRRSSRYETVHNRSIHEYVPLFLNPKNPMLSKRRNENDNLVILELSLNVMSIQRHVFADGNAASPHVTFSDDSAIFEKCHNALSANYWKDVENGGIRRSAEVLVWQQIPAQYIIGAICYSEECQSTVAQIFGYMDDAFRQLRRVRHVRYGVFFKGNNI